MRPAGAGWGNMCHEHQLAGMNQALGITTLLLPARPELAAVSSTLSRGTTRQPALD